MTIGGVGGGRGWEGVGTWGVLGVSSHRDMSHCADYWKTSHSNQFCNA